MYIQNKLNAQELKMSKMISIKMLKNNIKDKPEKIALLLRILPYKIKMADAINANETIKNNLIKRYEMVQKLSLQQ
jgi:hypothetical protein